MIPLIGFAPDLDPSTEGVITDCTNVIPTLRGMAGAPTQLDAGIDALAAECRGAAVLTRLDAQRRVFAGTQTKMYELSGTSYVDQSRVGDYTGSTENRWRFAQFGNVSLACNQTELIQQSVSGAFTDIVQSPAARIIETASGFVLAFGLNAVYVGGDRPDAWACSNIYDHVTWTPSAGVNQAAFGYLYNSPGEIVAAKRIGNDVAVYKERSMYLGRYVGPPIIWQFDLVAANAGAISQESVIDTGTAHLFIGRDDFWIFDGSRPRPIGAPIKEWFFANSDNANRGRIRSYFDQFKNMAWWFYPTPSSGGALAEAVVYNLNNDRWGRVTIAIQVPLLYQAPETPYDDWPPGPATTFDTVPDYPFDSPAFDTDSSAMGVIGSDGKIKTLTGPCAVSVIITGDLGSDEQYTTMTKITPHFTQRPTASSVTHFTKDYVGDVQLNRGSSELSGNQYDVLASGRLHRFQLEFSGDMEIVGITPLAEADGTE